MASITLNTGATIGCGRALASTGAVTMDMNRIGGGCGLADNEGIGNSLSGGITIPENGGPPVFLPLVSVPEPSAFILFGLGLAGLFGFRRRAFSIGLRSSINRPQSIC